jgi:hypothetical protein
MDVGVVTVLPANDTGGPIVLSGDVRRVRAYLRCRIYGQPGSNVMEGCSPSTNYVAKLNLPGGGVLLSGKADGHNGESDTMWRRRPSGSAAAGKLRTESF